MCASAAKKIYFSFRSFLIHRFVHLVPVSHLLPSPSPLVTVHKCHRLAILPAGPD